MRLQRVYLSVLLPTGCRFIRAQSPVTEAGHLRTWLELSIRRKDWTGVSHCLPVPPGSKAQHIWRWITSRNDLWRARQWRVQENGWHVDVRFDGTDLTYPETELIVLAIRHQRLVNRLRPTMAPAPKIPVFDANAIYQMYFSNDSGIRMYYVCLGRVMVEVRIVAGTVELLSYGIAMS